VHVWGYQTTDRYVVDGVLRSLSPSYKDDVGRYIMEEKVFIFHGIIAELRTLVEPIAGEVVHGEGILDIRIINVLPYQYILRFTKYLIGILFYLKT
jgi:hypothetical protein